METCWADSARASANMRAAFFGGGGGAVVGAVELIVQGVQSFKESGDTSPNRDTKTERIYSGRIHKLDISR